LRTNIGRVFQFDNSKSKSLGLQYTDLTTTLFDTVNDLISKGHIPNLKEKEASEEKEFVENLIKQMRDPVTGVKLKERHYHLHTYHNSFVGKEAVDWIMEATGVKHRVSAIKIAQEMVKLGAFHHVTDKQEFTDEKSLYVWD